MFGKYKKLLARVKSIENYLRIVFTERNWGVEHMHEDGVNIAYDMRDLKEMINEYRKEKYKKEKEEDSSTPEPAIN